jgi:hypothetical protein
MKKVTTVATVNLAMSQGFNTYNIAPSKPSPRDAKDPTPSPAKSSPRRVMEEATFLGNFWVASVDETSNEQ